MPNIRLSPDFYCKKCLCDKINWNSCNSSAVPAAPETRILQFLWNFCLDTDRWSAVGAGGFNTVKLELIIKWFSFLFNCQFYRTWMNFWLFLTTQTQTQLLFFKLFLLIHLNVTTNWMSLMLDKIKCLYNICNFIFQASVHSVQEDVWFEREM